MNYLKQNRANSIILPYDVMNIIYEYADPMSSICKQINNKEYDLDEIMYKKMKNYISKFYFNKNYSYFISNANISLIITKNNINDITIKEMLLTGNAGYKKSFLFKHKNNKICGHFVFPKFMGFIHNMIDDLLICSSVSINSLPIHDIYKIDKLCNGLDIHNIRKIYNLWINI